MAGVGATERISEAELPFRRGDTVFLRRNLHPADDQNQALLRGASGEVTEVRSSDDTVKVRFGSVWVRCRTDWLESAPGTICLGMNALAMEQHLFYNHGMMETDFCFPLETHGCFERYNRNWHRLADSGFGFSHVDSVDASASRWRLSGTMFSARVGLVLCEEIWPWDRQQWPHVARFHASIARSLMGQWGEATCVMVLRRHNAQMLQAVLGPVRRISYHYGNKFKLHYTPLQMDNADPPTPVTGEEWCAIVIHPMIFATRLVAGDADVFLPELVLKTMFSSKGKDQTLQMCAYTLESAIGIMEYLAYIKQLHGL